MQRLQHMELFRVFRFGLMLSVRMACKASDLRGDREVLLQVLRAFDRALRPPQHAGFRNVPELCQDKAIKQR